MTNIIFKIIISMLRNTIFMYDLTLTNLDRIRFKLIKQNNENFIKFNQRAWKIMLYIVLRKVIKTAICIINKLTEKMCYYYEFNDIQTAKIIFFFNSVEYEFVDKYL